MALYKRGFVYWLNTTIGGRRYQVPTGCNKKEPAEKWEAGFRNQVALGKVDMKDAPKYTGDEVLDRLKQRWQREDKCSAQNMSLLKKAREDWGTKMASEITKDAVEAYMARRKKQGYAIATTNRVLQLLRAACRHSDVAWPKVKLPKENNVCGQRFTSEQWKKLLTALPDDDMRDFATWSYESGMRKGEASKLTWDMCSEPHTVLHIPAKITKPDTARDIELEGELAKIIKQRWAKRFIKVNDISSTRESKYIFHRGNGEPVYEFRKSWRTACRAAGAPTHRFHDFRVTFATDARKAGNPECVVMKMGGWSTRSVFDRYNLVDKEDVHVGRERMAKHRANG